MIVTMQIPESSRAEVAATGRFAERAPQAMLAALTACVYQGADTIRVAFDEGKLGIQTRHTSRAGLADSVMGWMIDPAAFLAAVGVPDGVPAAAYADIQNRGGPIYAKPGQALAIPISEEARNHEGSPRDFPDLTFIRRNGRPPMLVRMGSKTPTGRAAVKGFRTAWDIMYILVASVQIPATHWFDTGVELAKPVMQTKFEDVFNASLSAEN